jgi:hypothetical protein
LRRNVKIFHKSKRSNFSIRNPSSVKKCPYSAKYKQSKGKLMRIWKIFFKEWLKGKNGGRISMMKSRTVCICSSTGFRI